MLIIEDEAIIAPDIEILARDLGHHVIGIAATHNEAVDARARPPARPGPGRHPARRRQLRASTRSRTSCRRFDVPVIFITAFPERLLTGERPEPTFLITKPSKPETVKAAISQALFFERKATRVA